MGPIIWPREKAEAIKLESELTAASAESVPRVGEGVR